jgi:hypothetical protein
MFITENLTQIGNSENGFDSLFGRNKQKVAEKKIRKSEKKLSKGKVRQSERKLKKADRIMNRINSQKSKLSDSSKRVSGINEQSPVMDTMNVNQTESMATDAGQIGAMSSPTTSYSNRSISESSGGIPNDEDLSPFAVDEKGDIKNKQLPDVTVFAKKKKSNLFIIIGLAMIIILSLFLFYKQKK